MATSLEVNNIAMNYDYLVILKNSGKTKNAKRYSVKNL